MRPDASLGRRRTGHAVLGLVLSISLLTVACSREHPQSERTNVLLIVVDTLRADRLGSYGASRDSSPNLDTLASRATRFERAYSAAPWTQPSVGSILTGLHPEHHRASGVLHGIARDVPTLAQTLNHRGWNTGAIVSHHLLAGRFGFDRGFESFSDEEAGDATHLSTGGVTKRALGWLGERARETRPFLLFVHYFDPHYPYLRHPEIGFAPSSEGRLDGTQPLGDLRRLLPDLTDPEIAYIHALYDEEVRYTDAGIGRLLDALDDLGLDDQTIVIVTADHGEELGERGWIGHTRTLYEELLRVPLLVRIPGAAGGRVIDQPVSLVSITPTILGLLGVRNAGDRFDAPSLEPLLLNHGVQEVPPSPVFSSVDFVPLVRDRVVKEAHKRSVVNGRYKLIRDDRSGAVELYDLEIDPLESDDLSRTRTDIVDGLLPVLNAHASDRPRSRPRRTEPVDPVTPVDPEEVERLRALGYAGDADDEPEIEQ